MRSSIRPLFTATIRPARSFLLSAIVGAAACGGAESPEGAGTDVAAPAEAGHADRVSPHAIEGCAGFTSEKAAVLLGLEPAIVTDYSRTEGRLRNCIYRQADRNTGVVSFTLNRMESVDLARRSMASDREAMQMADRMINNAGGASSREPAVQELSGIGDEAFFSRPNGFFVLRVSNVIAHVSGPDDPALRRRVAEEVAQGLRQ